MQKVRTESTMVALTLSQSKLIQNTTLYPCHPFKYYPPVYRWAFRVASALEIYSK
jgi:hypothetical protein